MKLNYCPDCAAPLTQQNQTDYVCANGHPYWNNPKGTASVIFIKDGQIMVSKRGINPFKGKYDFPGGYIQYGESPYEAAMREMAEETGVRPLQLELLEVTYGEYGDWGISTTDVFFVCTQWDGTFKPQDDVAELSWQPMSFLEATEKLAWSYPGIPQKLQAYMKQLRVQ